MVTPVFFFSLAALLTYVLGGVYFLYLWFASGKKHNFLLFWAYALGTALWFKVPSIITNTHLGIVQSDIYPLLFVGFLFRFLAFPAFMLGLATFREFSRKKLFVFLFATWASCSVVYYGLSLFIEGFAAYIPVWAGNIFFFIPVQMLMLFRLWRIWQLPASQKNKIRSGLILLGLGTLTLTVTSLMYIFIEVHAFRPDYWFFSVISSPWVSLLQVLSGVLLFFGFRILALSRIPGNK